MKQTYIYTVSGRTDEGKPFFIRKEGQTLEQVEIAKDVARIFGYKIVIYTNIA